MLLFIRIFLVLYGIIALGTGFLGISASFDPAKAPPMEDNNHRFVAAIWASMSLAFFYVAWHPSEVALFRFLMIALFIGGLVRASALRYYPATNPVDAEDLTQEALIKIISNLGTFNFASSFRTWAYRIVVNHFLNEKKKTNPLLPASFEQMATSLEAAPSIELSLEEREEKKAAIREVRLTCLSGMLVDEAEMKYVELHRITVSRLPLKRRIF
jgi:RNA polymerase sigma factor (sigma-70 family)